MLTRQLGFRCQVMAFGAGSVEASTAEAKCNADALAVPCRCCSMFARGDEFAIVSSCAQFCVTSIRAMSACVWWRGVVQAFAGCSQLLAFAMRAAVRAGWVEACRGGADGATGSPSSAFAGGVFSHNSAISCSASPCRSPPVTARAPVTARPPPTRTRTISQTGPRGLEPHVLNQGFDGCKVGRARNLHVQGVSLRSKLTGRVQQEVAEAAVRNISVP